MNLHNMFYELCIVNTNTLNKMGKLHCIDFYGFQTLFVRTITALKVLYCF